MNKGEFAAHTVTHTCVGGRHILVCAVLTLATIAYATVTRGKTVTGDHRVDCDQSQSAAVCKSTLMHQESDKLAIRWNHSAVSFH